MTIKSILENLDAKKAIIVKHRPLNKDLVKNLHEWFRIECTYTSNAIEGNTLTSSETAMVVEKGITVGGKTLREHLEAINHAEAFDYIVSLAQSTKDSITLLDILSLHRLIFRRIDDDNAGKLRSVKIKVSGVDFEFPDPIKVPDHMQDFVTWLHEAQEHAFIIAADAHLKFISIHPFIDGNGRTARLLMNLLFMQAGFLPALITPEDRNTRISSIDIAQKTGNYDDYYACIARSLERSLDIYINQLK